MKTNLRWKIAQRAEYFWWRRYLKNKEQRGYLDWKRKYWYSLLQKISFHVPFYEKMNILDAGCGPAGIFLVLEKYYVDAVDPLIEKYKELEHFSPAKYPHVNFISQPLEKYIPDKKYPVIFCMNAINHVEDIELSIKNLSNCCDKNGILLLSIDAHNYSFFKNLFRFIPGDILHPQQYDLKEYKELLEKYEFEVKEQFLLKEEFFFNHHMLVAEKQQKSPR